MIKSELIQIVASRNPHLYAADVARIVDAIIDEITDVLQQGGRAELRGFGTFSVKHRSAKAGRNPRTGEPVFVDEKWIPVGACQHNGSYSQTSRISARIM